MNLQMYLHPAFFEKSVSVLLRPPYNIKEQIDPLILGLQLQNNLQMYPNFF